MLNQKRNTFDVAFLAFDIVSDLINHAKFHTANISEIKVAFLIHSCAQLS